VTELAGDGAQHLGHAIDAAPPAGASGRECPQHRPAEKHRPRAESKRGQDVLAAPDAAVDVHLGTGSGHCISHLCQHVRGRHRQVELPATVAGDLYGGRPR
jgi:hypothetical protein